MTRFYPSHEISMCKEEKEYTDVIAEGAEILKNTMALIPLKWEKPAISLTGGIDSNTTFASANGIYDRFKVFSYVSAPKETIDAEAAEKIAKRFGVERLLFNIPSTSDGLKDYNELVQIIRHNNGYIINRNGLPSIRYLSL